MHGQALTLTHPGLSTLLFFFFVEHWFFANVLGVSPLSVRTLQSFWNSKGTTKGVNKYGRIYNSGHHPRRRVTQSARKLRLEQTIAGSSPRPDSAGLDYLTEVIEHGEAKEHNPSDLDPLPSTSDSDSISGHSSVSSFQTQRTADIVAEQLLPLQQHLQSQDARFTLMMEQMQAQTTLLTATRCTRGRSATAAGGQAGAGSRGPSSSGRSNSGGRGTGRVSVSG